MGLDITAVNQAVFDHAFDLEKCYNDNWNEIIAVWVNPDFSGRNDDLRDGCYRFTKRFDFRAGSYGGYNSWREELARMALNTTLKKIWADIDAFRGKPFFELINFADNEGVIGPITSAKLFRDFTNLSSKAQLVSGYGPFSVYEPYLKWTKAFDLAKDTGFVIFH